MISKTIFINERKLAKLITGDSNHIVNLKEDIFEYCNGFILVNCTYDLDLVIQKLFKAGAIANYKNWTPQKTSDLTKTTICEDEIEAIPTSYLKMKGNKLCNIFKIGDKYISYKKEFVDIFQNVSYKASSIEEIPTLRAYGDDKFIGLLMPIRDEHMMLAEIIGN
ncbi:hypothetical protein KTC96_25030 (plasmid) [Clostridium estertheticum]|uniref:hypothetical protein n=1 Tax=Clostridium estertheticum TaxID=238834 RepID=UPI001C7D9E13|nr:hypothetical protein [Clostridium estertheticum]MBX4259793.1 hypothetical protein [Clostridium estertheticum]WLC73285.1 hypothetical protein KTC96_25030 [Clostridium estertheticum]